MAKKVQKRGTRVGRPATACLPMGDPENTGVNADSAGSSGGTAVTAAEPLECPHCKWGGPFVRVAIHGGDSIRIDCDRCENFVAFEKWNPHRHHARLADAAIARQTLQYCED